MDILNTYNYLVPAAGTTRGVVIREPLVSGTVLKRDFRDLQLDGIPFIPSGVYIDNTDGLSDCTIVINEIGFKITAQAGQSIVCQYPAPSNQSASISGDGQTTIVFVDYPVIPFILGGSQAVTVADGDSAAIGSTTDTKVTDPDADASLIAINKGLLESINTLQTNIQQLENIKLVQLDSTGNPLPDSFDTLPQALAYNVGGDLTSITVTSGAGSYVQTFSYTGANLTGITGWVKQ